MTHRELDFVTPKPIPEYQESLRAGDSFKGADKWRFNGY